MDRVHVVLDGSDVQYVRGYSSDVSRWRGMWALTVYAPGGIVLQGSESGIWLETWPDDLVGLVRAVLREYPGAAIVWRKPAGMQGPACGAPAAVAA